MLTESLGDELAAKDLIDIALAMDEFKWVCISQTFVHTFSSQVWVLRSLKVFPLTATVSTQAGLRDEIRTLVQAHVDHNVRFLELEYQP